MSKIIKLTESDLARIISEKLEGETNEGEGILSALFKKGAQAAKSITGKGIQDGPLLKKHLPSGYNKVVSSMRTEVAQLLAKTPTIKISPKTIKVLEEPRYNVRSAFDNVDDIAIVGNGYAGTAVRGEYSGIHWKLDRATKELRKPVGQQLNIKQLMEDLYSVRDEIAQDLFKRKNLPNAQKELQAPLNRVISAINHIENLFKTPDKPTSYLVKEEPKL